MTRFAQTFLPVTLICTFLFAHAAQAQCPQVEAIMVDACGTEQLNEFVIINSGAGFNTSDLQLSYDANNNILGQNNNDINMDINNFAGAPCGLTTGNVSAFTGCSNVTAIGPGFNVPANSIVILQNSATSSNGVYNFSGLCGSGQCVYVISSDCIRSAGGFSNAGAGMRTTIFQIAGGCVQTITYNQASLVGGNGAYYLPLTNMYGNAGCVSPPTSPAPMPPSINDIPNVTICGSYTLPPITGTNLTANVGYFTGPNRTGTQLNPGDVITTSTTIYMHDYLNELTCFDQENFTITITPAPTMNQPADITVCAGAPVSVSFTGSAGATFPWTNDNTAIGLGASGTGNISFTSANVANQEIATITVTPTTPGCPGTPVTFTITVNPRPTVDDPPNLSVCGGDQVMVPLTGTGNPTFNWTNNNTAIGLDASGSGDIDFTAATPATTITGTITITPVENGCTGPTQNFTITVAPIPNVNQPNNVTVCGGSVVNVNFTGTAGATFTWTNDNTSIGLVDSGTGNISFTSANVNTQETAIITVTPQVGICAGIPKTFIITINPVPTVDPPTDEVVCGGDLVAISFTGNGSPTFNWTNTNAAIGLPLSGSGDIGFNAAAVTTTQTGTITVTPSAPGCPGTPETFTITVNPSPIVNQPANITVCGGSAVNVNFTGTAGATFSWNNSNPLVGLSLTTGTGNISFTSASVSTQQVATITVTPQLGNCPGTPRTFTITVNPTPSVNDPADQTVCGSVPVSVLFTGNGSPTFNWTNSNPAIGLGASGSGDINFTSAGVATPQTGTITVTPALPGCSGTAQTFTITVNPAPTVNAPANVVQCAGTNVVLNFTGTGATTYAWTNSNPAIGLGASGTGNFNFVAASVASQQVANIQVVPQTGACSGPAQNFTITINPAPVVNPVNNIVVCGGDPVAVNFSGTGASYSWTNSNPAIGLGASGTGNISFNSIGAGNTGTITVTPAAAGCPGISQTFTISVESQPSVAAPANQSFCAGLAALVNFSGTPGATYNWTNSNPAIGLAASGSGNLNFMAASVATATTATITVTPVLGSCTGTSQTFDITIQPAPSVTPQPDITICAEATLNINFNGSLPGTFFSWSNDNAGIGLPAGGTGNISQVLNSLTGTQTANLIVVPQLGVCQGAPDTVVITANPVPVLDSPGDQSVCGGQSLAINWTATASPVINWTNNNTATGLGASGTGNIAFTSAAVAATTISQITATPVANGCSGLPVNFNINVVTLPVVNNPGTQSACGGSNFTLNFSGTAGVAYSWSNDNPNIGLASSGTGNLNFTTANPLAVETAQITVTPQLGACSGAVVVFTIAVQPVPALAITGNTVICAGQSTALQVNGGSAYNWDGGQNTQTINVSPVTTSNFTVTVTHGAVCTSVLNTTVTVNQPSATNVQLSSCNPADTGTVVTNLTNFLGCDSIVTTTTVLLPSSTTNVSAFTCNPNNAGTFTQVLTNFLGCDSTVITTITFDPNQIDTTYLTASSCDPAQTGTTQQLFTGADGCDSLVITTTSLLPENTTNIAQTTCNPNNAGTFTQVLTNIFGCDSTIVTTVSFVPDPDTTILAATTCDPAQVGATQQLLTGADGCDSLIITNTTLLPSNTTNIAQTTCNPNNAGTFTQVLTNIFGCDSTIVTTVSFVPDPDTTILAATTCDPAQVGATQQLLTGADGCDSLIITNTTLLPSNTTNIAQTTCKPANAGVFTQVLTNVFGCDSTVVTTVTFDPTLLDTTIITQTTCNPAQVGSTQVTLGGVDGCDSLVITQTIFDPALCAATAVLVSATQVLCAGAENGSATFSITAGSAPFQYNWSDTQGNTGSGVVAAVNTPAVIQGLAAGNFTVTITQASGPSTTINGVIGSPQVLNLAAQAVLAFNGLAISCAGAADGSAQAQASGGTPGYQFVWSSGGGTSTETGLSAGNFTVTVTDANNCTATATVTLSEPAPLDFELEIERPDCGAQLTEVRIDAAGGTGPYKYSVDGIMAIDNSPAVAAGLHTFLVTDANGCTADAQTNIDIPGAIVLSLPTDTLVELGQSLTITAQTNLNVWDQLSWSPRVDTTCNNCLSQTWTPLVTQIVTITLVDTSGCVAKARILVKVDRGTKLYVPTVFSPDGDGFNDFWTISAGISVKTLDLVRIFDRWGTQLYEWNDPVDPNTWTGWDGNYRGEKAPPAVYVYYMWVTLANGEKELRKGDLTILR